MTGSHTLVLRMITFLLTVAMLFTDSRESREVICDLDCSFKILQLIQIARFAKLELL